jgi:oligopeptide/dipeptide ABC transporter ATP-binding protein
MTFVIIYPMPLLQTLDLHVSVRGLPILRGVEISVERGETLGIVGESGCGKSMTGLALMGMLPKGANIGQGQILLDGKDLTQLRPKDWLKIRGQEIAMVMQDPFTSLNPLMMVGDQIGEVYRLHQGLSRQEAWKKAVEMIDRVGVPNPEESAKKYPHQMSGGQRQRIVIATAFAAKPKLLIADEPTTALDVTLQAQILRVLRDMQQAEGTGVILISHDIGVIGSLAHRTAVFYAGQVVESGLTAEVLTRPVHPYTKALMASLPDHKLDRLEVIQGQPPLFSELNEGCAFAPRCKFVKDACAKPQGLRTSGEGHKVRCLLADSAVTP